MVETLVEVVASLDETRCDGCRECLRECRSMALTWVTSERMLLMDPWACTGCGACVTACPRQALRLCYRDVR